jgi:prepilin peptidase CpaA
MAVSISNVRVLAPTVLGLWILLVSSVFNTVTEFACIVPIWVGATLLVFAVLHDLAFRTIPNWIPATLLVGGILMRIQNDSVVPGLLAGFFIFAGTMLCWRRGWLGGGDVKLLVACGVLVRPALVVNLLLDVALCGGVLAILYLGLGRLITATTGPRPSGLLRRICRTERYRIHRQRSLPYASAIAAGVFVVLSKG